MSSVLSPNVAPARPLGSRRILLVGAAVLALYAIDLLVAVTIPVSAHAYTVDVAVPFDLVVFVPAVFYLLVVRRKGITPIAVLPVVWVGYIVSLQVANLGETSLVAPLMAFAETGRFSLLVPLFAAALALDVAVLAHEVVRIVGAFRRARTQSRRPFDWFSQAMGVLTSNERFAQLAGLEGSTYYYALFAWRAKPDVPQGRRVFSYHRDSGYIALVGVMLALVPLETIMVHLLVAQWSVLVACLLTATSLYALLYIVATARAVVLNPILVDDQVLTVRWAHTFCEDIPLSVIAGTSSEVPDVPKRERIDMGVMGATPCWLMFSEPVIMRTALGSPRLVRALNITPDNLSEFKRCIRPR